MDYQRFIKGRILTNVSKGTGPELILVFQTITEAASVRFFNLFPAAFAIVAFLDAPLSDAVKIRINRMMNEARLGGVGMHLIEASTDSFTYDIGPGYNVGPYSSVI